MGLSASQKEAIVALTLGTRDQITDLMRSAETGQDFNSARKTARQLRTETDTKIRELLSPSQYEAYKALDTDDDRSMGGGPPRSPR